MAQSQETNLQQKIRIFDTNEPEVWAVNTNIGIGLDLHAGRRPNTRRPGTTNGNKKFESSTKIKVQRSNVNSGVWRQTSSQTRDGIGLDLHARPVQRRERRIRGSRKNLEPERRIRGSTKEQNKPKPAESKSKSKFNAQTLPIRYLRYKRHEISPYKSDTCGTRFMDKRAAGKRPAVEQLDSVQGSRNEHWTTTSNSDQLRDLHS